MARIVRIPCDRRRPPPDPERDVDEAAELLRALECCSTAAQPARQCAGCQRIDAVVDDANAQQQDAEHPYLQPTAGQLGA